MRRKIVEGIIGFIAYTLFVGLITALLTSIFAKDKFEAEWRHRADIYECELRSRDFTLNQLQEEIAALESKKEATSEAVDEIQEAVVQEETEQESNKCLPQEATNMFMCMDYRKITNKESEQWKLQEKCTSTWYGIRQYEDYFTVALGSYYSHTIGDTFRVKLENGAEFNIIVGDFKDDGTDLTFKGHPCKNYDGEECINVIEFIVDMEKVPYEVKQAGTMSALELFGGLRGDGGNIIEMEYTGYCVWKS